MVVPLGQIAAGTVVVVCEPTPLGPIAADPVAVWAGLVSAGAVRRRWSRSPPLGRSPLGPIAAGPEPDVGAVVVGDGLDGVGVPDEPCLSPRVAISTNSNEL